MRQLVADDVRVQCVVTSPPYWGLRDYGHPGQLGLESTPTEYIANMVEVFRLVLELLADDGTIWLNVGDSYSDSGSANAGGELSRTCNGPPNARDRNLPTKRGGDLKPKDLCGIPWMLAFALRADGWYLRQDIIWSKPNPMPESVTDRCTKAHEYIFLLSKSERYFYDNEAIKEASVDPEGSARRYETAFGGEKSRAPVGDAGIDTRTRPQGMRDFDGARNKRSVWTVATRPYSEAHFATFPPALIEPCILAGSRPGDVVFDPFFGSGMTGQVAQQLGRQWLGCELNPAYESLQRKRTAQLGMELLT